MYNISKNSTPKIKMQLNPNTKREVTTSDRFRVMSLWGGVVIATLLASSLTSSLSGCGSGNWTINVEGRDRTIVVPSTASVQPPYNNDGSPPPRRYVVRMSDGNLDWEVELPEVATGYELRIPFKDKRSRESIIFGDQGLTDADKDLLENLRRKDPNFEDEGIFDEEGAMLTQPKEATRGERKRDATKNKREKSVDVTQPAPTRQSYLIGLEKSRQLFKAKKYELALVALKSLDADYPNDVTIKSMIGTLWLQLNQPELAREAWESALKIAPNNRTIIQALKQLDQSSGGSTLRGRSKDASPRTKKRKKRRLLRRRRVPKPSRSSSPSNSSSSSKSSSPSPSPSP